MQKSGSGCFCQRMRIFSLDLFILGDGLVVNLKHGAHARLRSSIGPSQ